MLFVLVTMKVHVIFIKSIRLLIVSFATKQKKNMVRKFCSKKQYPTRTLDKCAIFTDNKNNKYIIILIII